MQRLLSIYLLYKPFILWSFGVNVFLSVIEYKLVAILLIKLLLVLFLWYVMNETSYKKTLQVYKNTGVSTLKLFAFLYVIDLVLSIPFLIILREFI
jgi:hypothetical protein